MKQEMKQEMETRNNRECERLIDRLSIDGLDGHNKSVEWLLESCELLGAEVQGKPSDNHYDSEVFEIRLSGKDSGVDYRIKVQYRPEILRLLGKRIDGVNLDSFKEIETIYTPFSRMVEFDTSWFDHTRREWARFCIVPKRQRHSDIPAEHVAGIYPVTQVWPLDRIVSLMHALNDDLRSAMMPEMDTLRRELCSAYPLSWFEGLTDERLDFEEVSTYVTHLKDLQDTSSWEEFTDTAEAFEPIAEMLREANSARRETRDQVTGRPMEVE